MHHSYSAQFTIIIRSVKLVINKGEIINYNEIYIQHVTKQHNWKNTGERKGKEYTITGKWENEKQKEKICPNIII